MFCKNIRLLWESWAIWKEGGCSEDNSNDIIWLISMTIVNLNELFTILSI